MSYYLSRLPVLFSKPYSPAIPLRVIGANEQVMSGREGRASRNMQASRQPYIIGQDATSLVFSANNWLFGTTAEENNLNSITIVEAALETSSATYPIYWGGNRSVFLAAGDNNVQSDPLAASTLGLAKFSRDEQYWIKMIISVPNSADSVPYSSMQAADRTGGQTLWYLSSTVTLDVDATGTFPTANTESRSQGFRLLMLGYPVVDSASFLTIGDSIAVGIGDATQNGGIGRGFIQRAMCNVASGSGPNTVPVDSYAHMNFGRSGIAILAFNNGTKWKSFLPYARVAIDQILTNNVTGTSVATLQGYETTLWGIFRSAGYQKIMRTELLVRTSSTDNYATTANQTPFSGWGSGSTVPQMNTWYPTKVSDSTIDYFVSGLKSSVANASVPEVWEIPKLNNNDDVHPNTTGAVTLKSIMRTALNAVASSL